MEINDIVLCIYQNDHYCFTKERTFKDEKKIKKFDKKLL